MYMAARIRQHQAFTLEREVVKPAAPEVANGQFCIQVCAEEFGWCEL